jgi:opacity protein-like surface antigen
MKRLLIAAALATSVLAASAAATLAVNDPLVPGDNCAPDNAQAVGHPAFVHQPPQGANPPFSSNNPGVSTGARGGANSQAPCA